MRRNPDVQFGSFMRQVEAETLARHGIGISKLQQDLDPLEGPRLAEDAAAGMTPAAFVDALDAHYPLLRVGAGDEPAHVGRLNKGLMALGTFARDGEDWVQHTDGAIYRQDEGGVSRLLSAKAPAGDGYGFRAEHAPGGVLVPDLAAVSRLPFAPVAGGPDIADAVGALDHALEAGHGADRGYGR